MFCASEPGMRAASPCSVSITGWRDQVMASCRRARCRSMRLSSTVLSAARPTAPPRLRVRLNRPEAFFSRSGGKRAERQIGDRHDRQHHADAAQAPAARTVAQNPNPFVIGHLPIAEREDQEAGRQHEARIEFGHQPADERRGQEHGGAGHEHGLADHQRVVAADLAEIDRIEVGQAVKADAEHEGKDAAEREVAVEEGLAGRRSDCAP